MVHSCFRAWSMSILTIICNMCVWVLSADPFPFWWSWKYFYTDDHLIIIIRSEIGFISHCLGLGHETKVCALCLSVFYITHIFTWTCENTYSVVLYKHRESRFYRVSLCKTFSYLRSETEMSFWRNCRHWQHRSCQSLYQVSSCDRSTNTEISSFWWMTFPFQCPLRNLTVVKL